MSHGRPSYKDAPLGDGEHDPWWLRTTIGCARRPWAVLNLLATLFLKRRQGPTRSHCFISDEPIAVVFSDVVMPGGMTGYDVAERVRSMRRDLKVLLTSGYCDMQLAASEAVRKIKVLGKPYTREQLAHALREALDG